MSFVDDLRRGPQARVVGLTPQQINGYMCALQAACTRNRTKGHISGYVKTENSDGYAEWILVENLPETNPAVVERQLNENLKKKYDKWNVTPSKPYSPYTIRPYIAFGLSVSDEEIQLYCRQLREEIRKLGFTTFSVTPQRVPSVVLEVSPVPVFNRVSVKSITKGYTYLIKFDLRW